MHCDILYHVYNVILCRSKSPTGLMLLYVLDSKLGDNCIQNFYLGRYIVMQIYCRKFSFTAIPTVYLQTNQKILFCLFDSSRPINNLSIKQGRVFRG